MTGLITAAAPVLVCAAMSVAAGVAVWLTTGSAGVLDVAGMLAVHAVAGLLGSFVVHEASHAIALGRCSHVHGIGVERRLLRISVLPRGELTLPEVRAVAVAGPGASALAGLLLAVTVPWLGLQYWYFAHLVFLLPPFGDGMALVRSVPRRRRPDLKDDHGAGRLERDNHLRSRRGRPCGRDAPA